MRNAVLLGSLIRIPVFASWIILTLHVVTTLGQGFSQAGVLAMCSTLALALSSAWRGRMLDIRGLRRTVLPQLVVLVAVWSVAPWVGYWLLLPLAGVAGLSTIPISSIVKKMLISSIDIRLRSAAISLDTFVIELSYVVAPVLGVLGATILNTRFALLIANALMVMGGLLLCVLNPRVVRQDREAIRESGWRTWVSPAVLGNLCAVAAAAVIVTGTEVSIVAALRSTEHASLVGWMIAIWALGSAVGALAYGALRRSVPVLSLLGLLATATLPLAWAPNIGWLGIMLFVAGLFVAPTAAATTNNLSHAIPMTSLGQGMGWHISAITLGTAVGAPLAGIVIDRGGWDVGFISAAAFGFAATLVGLAVSRWGRT